jgi:hypothetical protein
MPPWSDEATFHSGLEAALAPLYIGARLGDSSTLRQHHIHQEADGGRDEVTFSHVCARRVFRAVLASLDPSRWQCFLLLVAGAKSRWTATSARLPEPPRNERFIAKLGLCGQRGSYRFGPFQSEPSVATTQKAQLLQRRQLREASKAAIARQERSSTLVDPRRRRRRRRGSRWCHAHSFS